MCNLKEVADKADMIINGYAFTKSTEGFKVLNLNNPKKALLLSLNGEILETSMDDIENQIVKDYFNNNKKFLED